MKTRAAVAFEAKKPLEIVELDLEGPKPGEVLVEIMATGICHTDAYTLDGLDSEGLFPSVLGHEGCGYVDKVGPGVWEVAPGDPVMDADGSIKRLGELGKAYQRLSKPQRTPFYIDGWQIIVNEQYMPCGPAYPPGSYGVIAIKNNLRNFPKGVPHDTPQFPGEFHPDSWYFEGGKNDAGY